MTELEKLHAEKQKQYQDYLQEKAVYDSKIEDAIAKVKSYEKDLLTQADKLRPDMRDMVLNVVRRDDTQPISREYFENMRKLFRDFEQIGINILNGKEKWVDK